MQVDFNFFSLIGNHDTLTSLCFARDCSSIQNALRYHLAFEAANSSPSQIALDCNGSLCIAVRAKKLQPVI
jgi:hypothetical protein